MNNAFNVKFVWLILRILAVIFVWMTYLKMGSKAVYSADTGGLVFESLLPTLVSVFFFAALFTFINGVWLIGIIRTYFQTNHETIIHITRTFDSG